MTNKSITRRRFLKDAAEVGAALTAVSFLPAQWHKPVVQTGTLPEFAQISVLSGSISGTLTINGNLLAGVTIGLFAAPGGLDTELTTTTTIENGEFTFLGLASGSYDVAFWGKSQWSYRSDHNGAGNFITVTPGVTANGDIVFP